MSAKTEILDGLKTKTYVELNKKLGGRYDWRMWSSVDAPIEDLTIGVGYLPELGFSRIPVRSRMAELVDLRQVRISFRGRPEMMQIEYAALETIDFRAQGQQDTDKRCIGFYGVWEERQRGLTGWYCAAPGLEPSRTTLRCILEGLSVEGLKPEGRHISDRC